MKRFIPLNLVFFSLTLISCEGLFQFNPNQINLKDNERNLNIKNIEKVQALPLRDTVRFILMGDTQRWYDEAADFVKSANSQRYISRNKTLETDVLLGFLPQKFGRDALITITAKRPTLPGGSH